MSERDRKRWNARYRQKSIIDSTPADVLRYGERWLPRPIGAVAKRTSLNPVSGKDPASDRDRQLHAGQEQVGMSSTGDAATSTEPLQALDLACGRAMNGQWLAKRGFTVSAWDISEVVIAEIEQRRPRYIQLAAVRDVLAAPPLPATFDVIVVCRFLQRELCPAIAQALKPGGVLFYQTFTRGLCNPDYCLRANELLSLFDSLHILEYHDPASNNGDRTEARLIARQH